AARGRPLPVLHVSGCRGQVPALARLLGSRRRARLAVGTVVESASVGCAILAALGAGLHADVSQAVAAMTRRRQVDPVPGEMAEYEERYHRWREVYGKLTGWVL